MKITATAFYAPPRVETAEELAPLVGRSAAWIVERTGVARRHVCEEPIEEMAAQAGRAALGGVPPDLILNASGTPRQVLPDNAAFIERALGYEGIPAFTLHATCLSFLVGLQTASALLSVGAYRRILLVSAEHATRVRDLSEPESAVLLGDGAAAAVLEPTPAGEASALLAFRMTTWPGGAELTEVRGGGVRRFPGEAEASDNLFHMDGPGIYKLARRKVATLLDELFAEAGLARDEVALVVPHQASKMAVWAVSRYGFAEGRVVDVIADYGNCVAASLPMALAIANDQGRLRRGDPVLLLGTGAGLSVAAALIRW